MAKLSESPPGPLNCLLPRNPGDLSGTSSSLLPLPGQSPSPAACRQGSRGAVGEQAAVCMGTAPVLPRVLAPAVHPAGETGAPGFIGRGLLWGSPTFTAVERGK